MPIPYWRTPGFHGSRGDLGDAAPAFIVSGETTRAEVLRRLGSPEVEAPDASWFYYESNYLQHESGVIFVTGGAGAALPVGASGSSAQHFRRLYLTFGEKGLVSTAQFEVQACADIVYPLKPSAAELDSCPILRRGVELREERQRARLAAVGVAERSAPLRIVTGVLWKEGDGLPSLWASPHDDPLSCRWTRKGFGTLLVFERALVFVPPDRSATDTARVERPDLASVEQFGPSLVNVWQTAGVELTRADGKRLSFTVCGSSGAPELEQLKELRALLAQIAL